MTYVGVDWAGRGWLAVKWDSGGSWSGRVYPSMLNLWRDHRDDVQQILVDIPIGLPETDVRECDDEAREMLGSTRGRSVFTTPCREAVYEQCITDARETNEEMVGRNISNQTWSIVPSIREVDGFAREFPEAVGQIREAHPEVAFAGLCTDGPIEASKQSWDGWRERRDVLNQIVGGSGNGAWRAYCELSNQLIHDPPRYAPILGSGTEDDLVDAMALAVTAKLGCENGFEGLGGRSPEYQDDEGLPMEIVYAEPDG